MKKIAWSPSLDTAPGRARLARGSRPDGDEWRTWTVPTKAKSCSTSGRCGHSQRRREIHGRPNLGFPRTSRKKEGEYGGRPSGSTRPSSPSRPPMMRRSRPFFSRAGLRPLHTFNHPATVCLGYCETHAIMWPGNTR